MTSLSADDRVSRACTGATALPDRFTRERSVVRNHPCPFQEGPAKAGFRFTGSDKRGRQNAALGAFWKPRYRDVVPPPSRSAIRQKRMQQTSTSSTSRSPTSTEAIGEQIAPFEKAVELLCTIPGVQRRTAEVIIAEIGVDMSIFPTDKQLASWAGMCPGNDQSAGRRRSGKTRKGSKWLDWALEEAAMAAIRTKDVYLAAQYARLRPRRGHKKALGAVKHSILIACWHMLSTGELYVDLTPKGFSVSARWSR
jgi:hypothetical protein